MSQPAPPPAPEALKVWIAQIPRVEAIDNHGSTLDLEWWNDRIAHLPGKPVASIDGATDRGQINRGNIFSLIKARGIYQATTQAA